MGQEIPSNASTARNLFLQADSRYEHSESLEKILNYLDRYLDPSELRAPRFRKLIQELKDSIEEYTEDTRALMLAILEVDSALWSVGIKILSSGFQIHSAELGTGLSASLEQIQELKSKLQLAQSNLEKIKWDRTLADAYEIGHHVTELRMKVLDEFAVKSLGIQLTDYHEAAIATLREKIAQKVSDAYNEFIDIANSDDFKELAGVEFAGVVPIVGPLYRIGTAVVKLHNKAKEIADPYIPKGPIDELFNFIDTMEETNEFVHQQIAVLKAQAVYILLSRQSSSEAEPT